MTEEIMTRPYLAFKGYLRFLVNKIYYKKTCVTGEGNIPSPGTPLMIVSNRQNYLMDVLGIMLSINDRKVRFMTCAKVFNIHPLVTGFLQWLGFQPVPVNDGDSRALEQDLLDGRTVVMFPGDGYQDGRGPGEFSYDYVRTAFRAAELGGYEKDVVILPSCNSYSEYCALRSDNHICYGTPVHLQPFYGLCKEDPRSAWMEVDGLVRDQIGKMTPVAGDGERDSGKVPSKAWLIVRCLCLLVLLPVAFLAAWPSLLCWFIPKFVTKRVGNERLGASFLIALNALIILPICGVITLISTWIGKNLLCAIIYTALLPFLCCFEWYYWKFLKDTVSAIKKVC